MDKAQQALVEQILEMEIQAKKKEAKRNQQNQCQSHRIGVAGAIKIENQTSDFKSRSLKNSESIKRVKAIDGDVSARSNVAAGTTESKP